jgi:mRNA interferase RelE/StbE
VHEIQYTRKALKGLRKMPRDVSGRFVRNFEQLAEGNEEGLNIKALQGRDGFRMRIREWRAIYKIDGGRLVILVLDVGPRGGIYK